MALINWSPKKTLSKEIFVLVRRFTCDLLFQFQDKCPNKGSAWSLLPQADLENMEGLLVVAATMAILTMVLGWVEPFFRRRDDKVHEITTMDVHDISK